MAANPYQNFDTGAGTPVQLANPYKQVATAPDGVPVYQNGSNYFTQNADQSYTQQFQGGSPDWLQGQQAAQTSGSNPPQPTQQTGQSGSIQWSGDAGNWIDQQLQAVQSTDDPNYWKTQMAKDPKAMSGDPSALSWWEDAIRRGDGSALVKNGTLTKRAGGASGGSSALGSMFGGGLSSGDANALYAKLMGRADQSLALDPSTDPIIRPQVDAFDASRQRQDKNTLSSLAEQAGPNSNLEAAKRSAGEASGQATSSYQAGLAQNEVTARRQEIAQALQLGAGLLTQEQQMALQEELHNLDLQQNAYQFDINDQYRNSPLAWA
jgi:hypothetical protein